MANLEDEISKKVGEFTSQIEQKRAQVPIPYSPPPTITSNKTEFRETKIDPQSPTVPPQLQQESSGTIDVADDIPEEVDNVNRITFTGALNTGTIQDNGGGEVLVKIIPDSPDDINNYALCLIAGELTWKPLKTC